jgi:Zn-dependent protease
MIFKKQEINDLLIAWLGISICFTIILGGYSLLFGNLIPIITGKAPFDIINFFMLLFVSLIVTGSSFILHELAHKYVAIYYGAKARFVMWSQYVIMAIVVSLTIGFIFVAPGAVYIYGKDINLKENGIISLAGPLINIIVAFLFFISSFLGTPSLIVGLGIQINLWIAFFNLLPIGPLDGKKVLAWNPLVWVLMIAIPVFIVLI